MKELKEIHMLNYSYVTQLDDPSEPVSIILLFAMINYDYIPLVVDEKIQPFDAEPRVGY